VTPLLKRCCDRRNAVTLADRGGEYVDVSIVSPYVERMLHGHVPNGLNAPVGPFMAWLAAAMLSAGSEAPAGRSPKRITAVQYFWRDGI
jgi:hypothetical protein